MTITLGCVERSGGTPIVAVASRPRAQSPVAWHALASVSWKNEEQGADAGLGYFKGQADISALRRIEVPENGSSEIPAGRVISGSRLRRAQDAAPGSRCRDASRWRSSLSRSDESMPPRRETRIGAILVNGGLLDKGARAP